MKKNDIDPDKSLPRIDQTLNDIVVGSIKAGLGPLSSYLVGPLLEGLINCMPSRMDRIATFIKILASRLEKSTSEQLKSQLTNNNFQILFEEVFTEAMRAASRDRYEYLASVLIEGITADQQEIYRYRHLLQILSELNDEEILQLKLYSYRTSDSSEFVKKHPNLQQQHLNLPHPDTSAEDHGVALGNFTFQKSYLNHLTSLGLLTPFFEMDLEVPGYIKYRHRFAEQKIAHYEITQLGLILLMLIGILEEGEHPFGLSHAL